MPDCLTFDALKEKQRAIRAGFPETCGLSRDYGTAAGNYAQFMKRQLSLPVSTTSQWWVNLARSSVVV